VSVGVSCASDHVERCFAFFKDRNAAAPQSAQMLFRCRKLKAVTIAYQGTPWGMSRPPRDRAALCAWATAARNAGKLPDQFNHARADLVMEAYGETATDPAALEQCLSTSFAGQMWVSARLEEHRSALDFVGRLRMILERAGIAVELADKAEAPELEELSRVGLELEEGVSRARTARSLLALENVDAAVEIKADLAARGVALEDDHTPRLRTEKLGLALERTATAYGVSLEEIKAYNGPTWATRT
jgi:hypothetical protein